MMIDSRSVRGADFGLFLSVIFDEWVRHDVGFMFIPFFDAVLASYVYGESTLCALRPTCGDALALEHNGDVYACDHYVDPAFLLGNILETPVGELLLLEGQRAFGRAKSASLPGECRECRFLFTCHGECPKNRVLATRNGEPGLNWLCDGLKAFFAHTERPMQLMAGLLSRGQSAGSIMRILAEEEGRRTPTPGRSRARPASSPRTSAGRSSPPAATRRDDQPAGGCGARFLKAVRALRSERMVLPTSRRRR
jgi:uncharacterized protein